MEKKQFCRQPGCGAEIIWAITKTGSKMCVDTKDVPYWAAEQGTRGAVMFYRLSDTAKGKRAVAVWGMPDGDGQPSGYAYRPHWATCKNPPRRPRKPDPDTNRLCEGCRRVKIEPWDEQKTACRCMSPKVPPYFFGRVVALVSNAVKHPGQHCYRPAWCPGKEIKQQAEAAPEVTPVQESLF